MKMQRLCEQCGVEFMRHACEVAKYGGRFCSVSCGLKARKGEMRVPGGWKASRRRSRKSPEGRRKDRAREAVARAIRSGRLVRGECEVCGYPDTEAHHDDYDRQLDVRWRCRIHHEK